MSDAVDKYLGRWAEPEARLAAALPGHFDHALTVPVYGEEPDSLVLLDSLAALTGGRLLLCLTLNARDDSPQRVLELNAALPDALTARYATPTRLPDGARLWTTPFGALLLLDRSTPDRLLPRAQGVGLARKIGADLLLALRARGRLRSSFIAMTDADAVLPSSYLCALGEHAADASLAALVFAFVHHAAPGLLMETAAYECKLRAHVLGLASAGSPYAFHTIGSTIAVRAESYAQVRGVPKRHGAEDFYLLNKLAKVGSVMRLAGAPIQLQGRASDRVPFGTGPALAKLAAGESVRLYDPRSYHALKVVLRGIDRLAGDPGAELAAVLDPVDGLASACLLEALMKSGFASGLIAARGLPSARQRLRALHTFFDAFRSLKLIHALRPYGLPDVGLHQGLRELMPNQADEASAPELATALAALETKRAVGPIGVALRAE